MEEEEEEREEATERGRLDCMINGNHPYGVLPRWWGIFVGWGRGLAGSWSLFVSDGGRAWRLLPIVTNKLPLLPFILRPSSVVNKVGNMHPDLVSHYFCYFCFSISPAVNKDRQRYTERA